MPAGQTQVAQVLQQFQAKIEKRLRQSRRQALEKAKESASGFVARSSQVIAEKLQAFLVTKLAELRLEVQSKGSDGGTEGTQSQLPTAISQSIECLEAVAQSMERAQAGFDPSISAAPVRSESGAVTTADKLVKNNTRGGSDGRPTQTAAAKQLKLAFRLDKEVEDALAKMMNSALEKAHTQVELDEAIEHDVIEFQNKSRAKAAALKTSQTSELPTDV